MHQNVRYNCRIIALNQKILLIRPKLFLANDGNYREMRYFTPWARTRQVEEHYLPRMISEIVGQRKVPFGDAAISTLDTCLAAETCEELFTPAAPHTDMSLAGVEIFTNSSGSHHELRKLNKRIQLMTNATGICGGVYLYANQQGCDGDRLYYDGCAMIGINGRIVAQGSQFSLKDVEVVTATVDLEEVRSYRFQPSRGMQAIHNPPYQRVEADISLSMSGKNVDLSIGPTKEIEVRYHKPEEEIALGPACWLWDYLRRCGGVSGYFLPLSGGIDSCATATIVHSMCRLVVAECAAGDQAVINDARRVCREPEGSEWIAKTPQELANRIFHTSFMGTENSSKETRQRAKELAEVIGAYHVDLNMDSVVEAVRNLFSFVTGKTPAFRVHGGSRSENLALQNIQVSFACLCSRYADQGGEQTLII
jgi:NAD+ synthase (glutamine-hydrolysing)